MGAWHVSVIGAIRTAVLAEVATAITATTLEKMIPVDDINVDDMPHAQMGESAGNVAETLPWRIEKIEHGFTLIITDINKTEEEMLTHYDDIVDHFLDNQKQRLANTVQWIKFPSYTVIENVDANHNRSVLVMEVVAEIFR